MSPTLRHAVPSDAAAIERLMKESMAGLGRGYYSDRQIESACRYVAVADHALIAEGTYLLLEEGGRLAGCGDWSRRGKLYSGPVRSEEESAQSLDPPRDPARIRAMFVHPDFVRRGIARLILQRCEEEAGQAGFTRLELMATLPGVPLYLASGFSAEDPAIITLPDGARLESLRMTKWLR